MPEYQKYNCWTDQLWWRTMEQCHHMRCSWWRSGPGKWRETDKLHLIDHRYLFYNLILFYGYTLPVCVVQLTQSTEDSVVTSGPPVNEYYTENSYTQIFWIWMSNKTEWKVKCAFNDGVKSIDRKMQESQVLCYSVLPYVIQIYSINEIDSFIMLIIINMYDNNMK